MPGKLILVRHGQSVWNGKPGAVRRVARHYDGWLPILITPEEYARSLAAIRAETEAAGRDPDVLGQVQRAHARRQPRRLPAVADDDDVELDVALAEERVRGEPQVIGPPAREHDACEARAHRRRLEARMATSRPVAMSAARGTSAMTSARVPVRSPTAVSTTAAASASSVVSIATKAR